MVFPDIIPTSTECAVVVKNGVKAYGRGNTVLNGISLHVDKGTIYGLLGASGCGKTTLLSCIVGLRKLDSGSVKVFDGRPGKDDTSSGCAIGYMPQDIALYPIFTIQETLLYFGMIYGMTNGEIEARTEFLVNFLRLPKPEMLIQNLSGGELRRVSFAVALIHSPPLLILDEPTVGVDPLLRESIWKHLREMVTIKRTTVIVTTHYIDEARHSNKVGFMRHGRLLAEGHPKELLAQHAAGSLEDVVLKLCHQDKEGRTEKVLYNDEAWPREVAAVENVIGVKYQKCTDDSISSFEDPERHSNEAKFLSYKTLIAAFKRTILMERRKIHSVLKRNFLLHFRQPVFVLVQLILPVLQILIFNIVMTSEPYGLNLAVVNDELFGIDNFDDYCRREYSKEGGCFQGETSCHYFNNFEMGQVDWYSVATEKEAVSLVQRGKAMGYIVIPNNFTELMKERMLMRQYASNESIDGAIISVRLDVSNMLDSNYLTKELYERYEKFLQGLAKNCEESLDLVTLPMKYNAVLGTQNTGWTQFFQPAFICWIIFFIPTAVGVFYVGDVRAGTLDRSFIAGIGFRHLLISLLICEGFIVALQLAGCFIILIFCFDFQVVGSMLLCMLLSFMMGMVGVTTGMFVGVMGKHEMEVIMAICTLYMITVPASGGVWPLEGVPGFYRIVSYLVPVTAPLESLRSVINRGFGLSHPLVYQGLLVMVVWNLVCCCLCGLYYKLKK